MGAVVDKINSNVNLFRDEIKRLNFFQYRLSVSLYECRIDLSITSNTISINILKKNSTLITTKYIYISVKEFKYEKQCQKKSHNMQYRYIFSCLLCWKLETMAIYTSNITQEHIFSAANCYFASLLTSLGKYLNIIKF